MTYSIKVLISMLLLSVSLNTLAENDPMRGHGTHKNLTPEQKENRLREMQEHMLTMHDLSNQILAEKNAEKKEALKAKQLNLMRAHKAQMMQMHQKMMNKK